mgnify:CR=1 FL=1
MEEPIRILHIVGRMGQGGIESLIMNLYRNIDRDKVQFDFLCHEGLGGVHESEIRSLGGRIYEMPKLRSNTDDGGKKKTYYWKIFAYRKALKKFFASHPEYKIIHGHMTNTATIYMPIAKKFGNVKCCIAHSHQSEKTPGLSGTVTNILQKNLFRVATDYFACSEMAAEWIYPKKFVEQGKVRIIKNGVDTNKFRYDEAIRNATRESLNFGDKYVVGNVSRFKTQKNHTFMIDVFRAFHEQNPDSVLMLVGNGERMEEIKAKVADLGLSDSVLFMGTRKDVYNLMQAMDMFLLPSLFEGLPVSGIEAQATGLPMVTSTEVSKETDITGNCTFIPLSVSAKEWAEKMTEIRKNFVRHDVKKHIDENGFNIADTAKWLQEFYIEKYRGNE